MAGPVLVSGGTGLVGGRLLPALRAGGREVRSLSRAGDAAGPRFGWDGVHPPEAALRGSEAIVHLAGEPVFGGPPTAARRARIRESRVASTRAFVDAIAALPAGDRPQTFVCASAVGYYGDRGEEILAEEAAPGEGFLAEVCVAWEAEARRAEALGVAVARLRIGIVLAREGGALAAMARPFRLGLGGRLGHGRQWFPWIHADDLVSLVLACLEGRLTGAVNATAPGPVRNAELTRALGSVLRRPTLLPVPAFALRAGLGELAGELLGSRRVVPAAAEAAGVAFRHPDLAGALAAELRG
ncbi:MAG: TIGR01777 family oxidoreductase [Proteobacteria bacterium]|nr:TIGR01777 family oxidoreductase [Pseudomonadota bacterium]